MKIAYFSRPYRPTLTQGGNAHIRHFLDIVSGAGHEIWVSMPDEHPATNTLPMGRFRRLAALRSMDVIYCRIEWQPRTQCRLAANPYRFLAGRAKHVWEFNTVPDYGLLLGASQKEVDQSIAALRRFGRGCDLAVCVSEAIETYVKKHFRILNTIVVPNGSDPDIFHPEIPPPPRLEKFKDKFNIVWMGSADIPWHDIGRIIGAAGQLAHDDNIHFHLIGSGTERYDGTTPQVHGYGPVAYNDLPEWLSIMHIGLAVYKTGAATYASAPLKVFDYLASGLAILADEPQAAIMREMNLPQMILNDQSAELLSKKIQDFSMMPEFIKLAREKGRTTLIEKYTWRHSMRAILGHINKL